MRIRTQMIIALGVVPLLPLAGAGFLLRQMTREPLRQMGSAQLLTQARGAATEIDALIIRALESARVASLTPAFADFVTLAPAERDRAAPAIARQLRAALGQELGDAASLALLDRDGRDVLQTAAPLQGNSEAGTPWFLEPLRTGLPYSNIANAPGQREALWVGMPLVTAEGAVVGVVRLRYDEDNLQQLAKNLSHSAGQHTLLAMLEESTGRVVPCDSGFAPGPLRLPPDAFGHRGPADPRGTFWAGWSQAAAGSGVRDRVAYVKLAHIPWRVLLVRPAEAFFAVQNQFTNLLLLVGVFAAAAGIAFALLLSHLFTRPIEELTRATDKIAAGDLAINVSRHARHGEIAELARRFDHMAGRLRTTLDERDRQWAELERREERMRRLIDTSPLPLILADAESRVLQINQAFTAAFGYTAGEVPDLATWQRLAFPDPAYRAQIDRAGGFAPLAEEAARVNGRVAGAETRVTCRDGAVRTIEWHATRLGDLSLVVGVDLTERKRAEDTLRENEERFRALVENSHEIIVLTTLEGIVVYASANSAAISGYTVEETVGTPIFARVHPDDLPAAAAAFRQDQGAALLRYRFKDGTWRWLETAGRRFSFASGEQSRVIVARDVTARVETEEKNKRLATELRQAQKMEAIGTLAGGIAHDFNNILVGILGNAQLIQLQLPAGHALGPQLANIEKASLRARDLVAKILAFSRRGSELQAVHDLVPVVREAIDLLRASLAAPIEVRSRLSDRPLWVSCDPGQIHQVVMNLGTNAVYAMRERGGALTIALEEVAPDVALGAAHPQLSAGPVACLTVADTGEGMDAATRERIFEPFFTTKPLGEGSGLGLSVVHGIVEGHRGAVAVESAPGAGTTFRIYLPFAARQPSTPPMPPSSGSPRVPASGQCVLCVDDEPAVVAVIGHALTAQGYRPVTFPSPREALAQFQREPDLYSAVITDMMMPEMSGLEFAGAVRAIRPGVPVLVITGNPRPQEIERVRAEHRCLVLAKPFTLEALAGAMRQMLAP